MFACGEDDACFGEAADVRGGGRKVVNVAAWRDQSCDADAVAADLTGEVGEDRVERGGFEGGGGSGAGGNQRETGEQREEEAALHDRCKMIAGMSASTVGWELAVGNH